MVNLTYGQAQKIIEAFGGDENTIAQLSTGEGHSGRGLYLSYADHAEEGAVFIGAEE